MTEFIVTTTADSGAGSLRQAYYATNDGDVILFDETVFPAGTLTAIYLSSQIAIAKEIEIDGDGRVALDGQDSVRCLAVSATAHIKNIVIRNGATTNGPGVNLGGGTPTLTNCVVEDCNATSVCGGVYFTGSVIATLNNCTIRNCTAGTNGGGVYFNNTSQATLNDCVITNCTAGTSGGGMIAASSSQYVLNRCSITNCTSANYGGAAYAFGSSSGTFVDCTTSGNTCEYSAARRGVFIGGTASVSLANAQFEALFITVSAATVDGLSTVGTLTLASNADGAPTVTFLDGAALSVTTDATIPSGTTFTSETRGYLAVVSGVNTSGATFNNVFLCDYNPDRTYYYIGGAEGSFDSKDDWSLTKGGAALRYAPVVKGYTFVVVADGNDVTVVKGAEGFSDGTIALTGTNNVSVVVDSATVEAGMFEFTGTLRLTGDVAITGDASTLAVTIAGTLNVTQDTTVKELTLASDSSVVFSAPQLRLSVADAATLNNATLTCAEPNAFFSAPGETDLSGATFDNVFIVGAGVTDVTGVKAGKNYTINIFSTDNTKPVIVEYKGAGDSEWTVADDSFVGSSFSIRVDSDGELSFRVYDGENYTAATIKSYGVYHEMAAKVDIGYLK